MDPQSLIHRPEGRPPQSGNLQQCLQASGDPDRHQTATICTGQNRYHPLCLTQWWKRRREGFFQQMRETADRGHPACRRGQTGYSLTTTIPNHADSRLELVLSGIERNGPHDTDTLVLEAEDAQSELVSTMQGQELAELPRQKLQPARLA